MLYCLPWLRSASQDHYSAPSPIPGTSRCHHRPVRYRCCKLDASSLRWLSRRASPELATYAASTLPRFCAMSFLGRPCIAWPETHISGDTQRTVALAMARWSPTCRMLSPLQIWREAQSTGLPYSWPAVPGSPYLGTRYSSATVLPVRASFRRSGVDDQYIPWERRTRQHTYIRICDWPAADGAIGCKLVDEGHVF